MGCCGASLVRLGEGIGLTVSLDERADRLRACSACELATAALGALWCGRPVIESMGGEGCGCNVTLKSWLAAGSCPQKKWQGVK